MIFIRDKVFLKTETLWKIDSDYDEESTLIAEIKEENGRKRCFGDIKIINEKVYLIPFSANALYCVNLIDGRYMMLYDFSKYDTNKTNYNPEAKFLSSYVYEDNIYLFPATFPGIVKFNIVDNKITVFNKWIDELDGLNNSSAYFRRTSICNSTIIAPFCEKNACLLFELNEDKSEIIFIGQSNMGFSSVGIKNKKYYLSPRGNGCICVFNTGDKTTNTIQEIEVCRNLELYNWNGKIVGIPTVDGEIIVIDECDKIQDNICNIVDGGFSAIIDNNNHLVLLSRKYGNIYVLNEYLEIIKESYLRPNREKELLLRKNYIDNWLKRCIDNKCNLLIEESGLSIKEYLQYVERL